MLRLDWKTCMKLGTAAFVLFLTIFYWQAGVDLFQKFLLGALPLLLGLVMAYLINILMMFGERHYAPGVSEGWLAKSRRPVCILLSYLLVVMLIGIFALLVVPEFTDAIHVLLAKLPGALEQLFDNEAIAQYLPELSQCLSAIDWEAAISQVAAAIQSNIGTIAESAAGTAYSIASMVVTGVLGFVFSIYILLGKETLRRQGLALIGRYVKPRWQDKLLSTLALLNHNFHRFIVGQCTEAVILGLLCGLGMALLRLPYALTVGVLVGSTALIPVVGALIGAAAGFMMVLTSSVQQALVFLVFVFVLQQLEGNLIYPRVVGNSIGLPALWVLAAVVIGGGLFGVPGVLISVPLTATGYQLLADSVHKSH